MKVGSILKDQDKLNNFTMQSGYCITQVKLSQE
jgi:hypothetical protein